MTQHSQIWRDCICASTWFCILFRGACLCFLGRNPATILQRVKCYRRPHSADIQLAIAKYLSKASACYMGVMKSGEIKQPSFAFMIQGTEKQNLERLSLRNMFWQRIGTAFCRKREEARALLQDSLSFTATHVDDHSMQQPMSAEPILMETLYSTQKSIPSQTFGYGQTQSFQLWDSSLLCLL
jgi:hypothetical protein